MLLWAHHVIAAMMPFSRITRCLPLVGLLVQLIGAESSLVPAFTKPGEKIEPRIEAPELEFDKDGSMVAPRGFVLRLGDRVLIGDALRYHQKNDDLYATGRVVMVMGGVRLHAERLGFHPNAESGEAWNVEAFIEHAGRRITITAEKVHLDRTVLRFDGVKAITGHGGIAGISAGSARVYLRETPAKDRVGFEKQVSGIEVVNAAVRASDVSVLWLPYLYRDFVYDYPWTRYEGGKQRRLGFYARGWVGTSFREIWDWHPRIEVRGDTYSRTGEAWGAKGQWESSYGHGQASYYVSPHEIVMGGSDDLQNVATREASVTDLEQQLHGLGGAIYARWVSLPDADPAMPGDLARPWDDRFRADYLRNDLEHRPFARQGVTGTWGNSFGTITLDTERRANDQQLLTDRLWGVQVSLPQLHIAGPLHISGSGWTESLENSQSDDAAVRTSYQAQLSAMKWFGPLGFDLGGGIDGISYQDARFGGVDLLDNQTRLVPILTGGVRTRFLGDWGGGLSHTFTPRVGVEWYEEGHGDILNAWRFGDARDTLIENRHLATAGFDTSINGSRTLFRATTTARWALRLEDRFYTDDLGNQQTADSTLYDIFGTLEGSPIASWVLTGAYTYNAQSERFSSFDLGTSWVPTRYMVMRYNGSLIPETATTSAIWQHRPGLGMVANRYRFDGDITFRPGGSRADEWMAQITRRMVDGDLTLTYELLRDSDGNIYDRRIGVGFSMSVGGGDAKPLSELPSPRGVTTP
jgi:hypothetical protein